MKRLLAALAALAFVAGPAPASTAAIPERAVGSGAAPIELAGDNTVRAAKSSVISVRLVREAVFFSYQTYRERSLQVRGGGKLAGLALVQDVPDGGGSFVAGRLVTAGGDRGFSHPAGAKVVDHPDGTYTLPAGNYKLVVFTDGAPGTFRLRLGGLIGTRQLTPRTQVPFTVKYPPLVGLPQAGLISSGAEGVLPVRGLVFSVFAIDYRVFAASQNFGCFYNNEDPPQVGAYAPGCPDAAGVGFTQVGADPVRTGVSTSVTPLPAGRYGLGFYQAAAGVSDNAAHAVFWLGYRPVPARGARPKDVVSAPARRPGDTRSLAVTGGSPAVLPLALVVTAVALLLRRAIRQAGSAG